MKVFHVVEAVTLSIFIKRATARWTAEMTSITCLRSSARMGSQSPSFDCESAHTCIVCIVVSFTRSLGRGCSAIFLWVLFGLMGPQSWTLCGPIHWQSLPGEPPQILENILCSLPDVVFLEPFWPLAVSSLQVSVEVGSPDPHCTGTGGSVCVKELQRLDFVVLHPRLLESCFFRVGARGQGRHITGFACCTMIPGTSPMFSISLRMS